MEFEEFVKSLSKTELFRILLNLTEKLTELEKKIYGLESQLGAYHFFKSPLKIEKIINRR